MAATFKTGDLENDIIRKILITVGGTFSPGDQKYTMLRKILVALGGTFKQGDLQYTILRKIVTQVGGHPVQGDLEYDLLRKWLQAVTTTFRQGDQQYDIYRKILIDGGGNITPPGPPAPVLDPVAVNWAARVVTNGGTAPSTPYVQAVSDLVSGMKTDGIWTKMIIVNGYVPGPVVGVNPPASSCYAPFTPILVGPGSDPWLDKTGINLATVIPTDGQMDISLNGFKGYVDTPKVFPSAIWASATNVGFSTYTFAFSPGNQSITGADDFGTPHRLRLIAANGGAGIVDCGGNDLALPNAAGAGFISVNRSANNNLKVFIASSTVPAATLLSNVAVDNTDPRATTEDFWIHGCNDPGGGNTLSSHILSFAAMHQALTLAEFTLFYNRVQAFRTAIGGGFV